MGQTDKHEAINKRTLFIFFIFLTYVIRLGCIRYREALQGYVIEDKSLIRLGSQKEVIHSKYPLLSNEIKSVLLILLCIFLVLGKTYFDLLFGENLLKLKIRISPRIS